MELHSYAKRRTLKKWTIEQKRKLVEARIAHDAWFVNKPSSLIPWKNLLILANLDDYNVFFARKQWFNMLARYKQYKQTRLGSNNASKAIDAELIKRINQEWEFFEPIHKFMTRKTTNLHSYALSHRTEINNSEHVETGGEPTQQEQHHDTNKTSTKSLNNETITINLPKDCVKENIPNNATILIQSNNISQDVGGIQLFSSDTNEEFEVIADTTRIISRSRELQSGEDEENYKMNCVRNTDHDFYSKRSSLANMVNKENCHGVAELLDQQSNYFADASEESQSSMNMVANLLQINKATNPVTSSNCTTSKENKLAAFEIKLEKGETNDLEFLNVPSTSSHNNLTQIITTPRPSAKPRLSESDKYYRHKRRFNRRMEKRVDAFLQVMGQVVKVAYPSVDVTPLMGTVTQMASSMGKVLSSDSEDENQSDASNINIP